MTQVISKEDIYVTACSTIAEGYKKVLEGLHYKYPSVNDSDANLVDTPVRAGHMLIELCEGYDMDPAEILKVSWPLTKPANGSSALVLQKKIEFHSLCAHHLAVIKGVAHVGYIPDGGCVVGLSKLTRLVDCFAHRLQLQENMTDQIADALMEHLKPLGAMVVIAATHDCMCIRGVQRDAETVTSAVRGVFLKEPEARAEFLSLI